MSNYNNMNIDYEVEQFYLIFKDSMNNFYKLQSFSRPLLLWSNILNDYQKKKQYDKILKKIKEIISLYSLDLMKVTSGYHIDILMTNIKRWNKVAPRYKIEFYNDSNNNTNIIFLLLDIFASLVQRVDDEEFINLFKQVELYLIYNDFTNLIEYSIKYSKLSILDKLQKYDVNVLETIKEMYNLDINCNTVISSRKLIKIINNA